MGCGSARSALKEEVCDRGRWIGGVPREASLPRKERSAATPALLIDQRRITETPQQPETPARLQVHEFMGIENPLHFSDRSRKKQG
jgi:hypothetical protein